MSPEQKAAALAAKDLGNAAFSAGKFAEAAAHFTTAIAADPTDHIFFSNRRRATRSAAGAARRSAAECNGAQRIAAGAGRRG